MKQNLACHNCAHKFRSMSAEATALERKIAKAVEVLKWIYPEYCECDKDTCALCDALEILETK